MDDEAAGALDDGWSVDDIAARAGCSREVSARLAGPLAAQDREPMSR
jgi:hypothetical protein